MSGILLNAKEEDKEEMANFFDEGEDLLRLTNGLEKVEEQKERRDRTERKERSRKELLAMRDKPATGATGRGRQKGRPQRDKRLNTENFT